MTLDTQFGGYKIGGSESGDLGNGWKDYVRVFFPGHGREDGPVGEHLAFQGNFLGSEYIKILIVLRKISPSAPIWTIIR